MTVPGNLSSPLLATAAAAAAAGVATKSLRFNTGDSSFLSRTPSSAGNRRTWTWAAWVKRNKIDTGNNQEHALFVTSDSNGNSDYVTLYFNDSGYISTTAFQSGSTQWSLKTSQIFRDVGAWMHIAWAVDLSQSTASNRVKLYCNGSQITDFITETYPSSAFDTRMNSTNEHSIGRASLYDRWYASFQLADIYFIDGSQLDPTSFGAYDDNGVWQAAVYSGTYGTNGFHLDFASGSDLGDDNSGNGNDFTPNNFSSFDGSVATANGALPILNTTGTYGGTVGSGTRADSSSSSIVLALPLNGANNGTTWSDQSATIKGSGSAKTITANNDAKTSTAESFFYGSSTFFDGSGDRLVLSNASDLSFTGDFTVETWLYISDSTTTSYPNGDRQIVGVWSGTDNDWLMTYSGTGSHNTFLFQMHTGGSTVFFSSGVDMSNYVGQWVHLATVRSSNSIQNYVNGVASGSAYSNSASFGQSSNVAVGGRVGSDGNSVKGYLSDLRIYLSAKYTGNFDVPSRTGGSGCDSLFDVPTNGTQSDTGAGGEVSGNYATLNPLNKHASSDTISNGNLQASWSGGSACIQPSTIAFSSGKYYYEFSPGISGSIGNGVVGIRRSDSRNHSNTFAYLGNGQKMQNESASNYGSSYTDGDIIGVAVDMDAGTIRFYKNGADQGQAYSGISGTYTFYQGTFGGSGGGGYAVNFGQRAFAYSAPSGFKALCTTNLPTPTIADGSEYFQAKTFTGNGSSQSITTTGLSPGLVWIKVTSGNGDHGLWDSVRGTTKRLVTNGTNSESTTSGVTAFNSESFTLGAAYNVNNDSYVAWVWEAASSTASNTDGGITSSVRANQSAGFSIVSYTGTGSNATVGHGLSAAPHMYIVKNRSNAYEWGVYHIEIGTGAAQNLNYDNNNSISNTWWNNTAPTNSVFSIGTYAAVNQNNANFIAYCFAPVEGFSAIGSYTGNGSSDGPFIYTSFRPAFLLFFATDGTHKVIYDSARDINNPVSKQVAANLTNSESDQSRPVDFLSNGFKIRFSSYLNDNNDTIVYACFAENPFQANGGLAR